MDCRACALKSYVSHTRTLARCSGTALIGQKISRATGSAVNQVIRTNQSCWESTHKFGVWISCRRNHPSVGALAIWHYLGVFLCGAPSLKKQEGTQNLKDCKGRRLSL